MVLGDLKHSLSPNPSSLSPAVLSSQHNGFKMCQNPISHFNLPLKFTVFGKWQGFCIFHPFPPASLSASELERG